MQNYEMEGAIEWQGRFDFSVLMSEGTRNFVPLYNSKVSGVLIPTLKIQSSVMLFNRKQVDLLGFLNQHSRQKRLRKKRWLKIIRVKGHQNKAIT